MHSAAHWQCLPHPPASCSYAEGLSASKFSSRAVHVHSQLLIWHMMAPSSNYLQHMKHTHTAAYVQLAVRSIWSEHDIHRQPSLVELQHGPAVLLSCNLLLHTSVAVTHKVRLTAAQGVYLQTQSCSKQAWWRLLPTCILETVHTQPVQRPAHSSVRIRIPAHPLVL